MFACCSPTSGFKSLSVIFGIGLLGLMLASGCNRVEPSKEAKLLMTKPADEVEFTYEEIMKMSKEDLEKNIADLSKRVEEKRKELPPSVAGATAGSAVQPKNDGIQTPSTGDDVPIEAMALPLEVMRQIVETK
ncbi:MAG: hypothetical protein AAFN77_14030 [Planctomycetota bacterium]